MSRCSAQTLLLTFTVAQSATLCAVPLVDAPFDAELAAQRDWLTALQRSAGA